MSYYAVIITGRGECGRLLPEMVLQRQAVGRQGAHRRVQHTPGLRGAGDREHGALQPRQQHEYGARACKLASQAAPTSQQQ